MDYKDMSIAARRELAMYHLRMNPKNRVQLTGTLNDDKGGCCALGLIAEAFDIPCTYKQMEEKGIDILGYSAYKEIGKAIDFRYSWIYGLNDMDGLTFAQIADKMSEAIKAEDSFATRYSDL